MIAKSRVEKSASAPDLVLVLPTVVILDTRRAVVESLDSAADRNSMKSQRRIPARDVL